MQAYRVVPGQNLAGLERVNLPSAPLGPQEVRVRVHAVSLNYRDLMVVKGQYRAVKAAGVVPGSDGAGEVIAVGSAVQRWAVGDRVVGSFFPQWQQGSPTPQNTGGALGGEGDGMLAEEVTWHEEAWVAIPAHLSYAEAATLPCAAVTAWNALFVEGRVKPGDTVLLLGTGGVSIWALQLAKAAGLRVLITSSSDEKLDRARALGADEVINYRTHPEWQDEVLRLTAGRGVDLVLEVGGKDTLLRSLNSARMGGTVAIIGGVSGFDGQINPAMLIGGAKRLAGVFVGSRAMLEEVCRFTAVAQIQPVIDRRFAFAQAREAFELMEQAGHFGKIVIEVAA
ncbi:NAD(P)-dependent alcohol dehydrogenase [Paucibacter sp. AS339]|uniref:zinc-dependent alcohol dehydrogenase family protein n=1 Tax=Paucibacter hankyongi TaxID=3133434 RepID=UPI003099CE84